jgi:hypothetical protein
LGLASLSLALWSHPEQDPGWWGPPQGPAGLGPLEVPQREDLSDSSEWWRQRLEPQAEVINGLLAGELTLFEAAIRFRDLSERGPPFDWENFRRVYPGRSDEERFCRKVIAEAERSSERDAPTRRAGVLARLEAELREYLGDPGTAGSPEP